MSAAAVGDAAASVEMRRILLPLPAAAAAATLLHDLLPHPSANRLRAKGSCCIIAAIDPVIDIDIDARPRSTILLANLEGCDLRVWSQSIEKDPKLRLVMIRNGLWRLDMKIVAARGYRESTPRQAPSPTTAAFPL